MNRPFLTAQVPYGNNGYTVLLSAVTPFHRQLAERALDAVPTVGAGVRENLIFVCREVSQKDTGRQGAASLIVTNIDVSSLQSSQCESLLRKLDLLIDSLEDLWKAAPPTSGRDCGPVQSSELQQWETDLKLDRETAAEKTTDASTPITAPGWGRTRSILAVGVLLAALAATILWPDSDPVESTIEPVGTGDSDAVATVSSAEAGIRKTEISGARKPVAQLTSLRQQLEAKWDKQNGKQNARLAVKIAVDVLQNVNEKLSEEQKQEIRDWLNTRFQMPPTVSNEVVSQTDSSNMGSQWDQIVAKIDDLGNVIFERDRQTLEKKISENVITDPLLNLFQELLDTTWLQNIRKTCDTSVQLDFAARSQIDIAFKSAQKSGGTSEWHLPNAGAAINAIDKFGNYQPGNTSLKASLASMKKLLTHLIGIETCRVNIRISKVKVSDNFTGQKIRPRADATVLEISVLNALHSETLDIGNVAGSNYTLGQCRQYIRPLVTGELPRKKTTNYESDEGDDDRYSLWLEFDASDKTNKKWFEHKQKTLELLGAAQRSLPGQLAGQQTGSSTVPQSPKGAAHAMP